MPPLNLQVSADNDECRLVAGAFQPAPPILEAGRWQAPAEMVGSGIRFQNVTIPQGATIDSAVLILTCWQTRITGLHSRISAEQEDNPGDFSGDNWISAWARLNNHGVQVDWDIALGGWVVDTEYQSPDIKTVIQEIVDRAGWVSGQAIVLSWDDFDHRTPWGALTLQRAYSYNVSNVKAAKLNIIYTGVVLPTVTTDPATGRGAIAATVNSTLNQDGGEACVCGFEWGLDIGYGTTTPPQSKTTGETFSQVIGGLQPGTTYHFRAFATNSVGTSYGADRSFATALVINKAYALAREEL